MKVTISLTSEMKENIKKENEKKAIESLDFDEEQIGEALIHLFYSQNYLTESEFLLAKEKFIQSYAA